MTDENCSKELIDGCFYVEERKWGTWCSYDIENKGIVTSLSKENCILATRFYLKLKQENRLNDVEVTYESTVGGKL